MLLGVYTPILCVCGLYGDTIGTRMGIRDNMTNIYNKLVYHKYTIANGVKACFVDILRYNVYVWVYMGVYRCIYMCIYMNVYVYI